MFDPELRRSPFQNGSQLLCLKGFNLCLPQ
jgi:hypothetical protein